MLHRIYHGRLHGAHPEQCPQLVSEKKRYRMRTFPHISFSILIRLYLSDLHCSQAQLNGALVLWQAYTGPLCKYSQLLSGAATSQINVV